MHLIEPAGACRVIRLVPAVERGEAFQALVPAGCWFGGTVEAPESFALVGCTVAPGFDFADFEMGIRAELIRQYPGRRALIESLSRG